VAGSTQGWATLPGGRKLHGKKKEKEKRESLRSAAVWFSPI
jgi:hypothetical protein